MQNITNRPKSSLNSMYIYYVGCTWDTVTFRNGYSKDAPTITVELLGIDVGKAKPEWSDSWQGDVFIIKLGKILELKP